MSGPAHLAFFILVPAGGNTSVSSQSSHGQTLSIATLGSLAAAEQLARELAAQGVSAIELSSSFGDEGLAAVREAAGKGVRVGRVTY